MFDAKLRPAIDAMLKPVGQQLVRWGITANQVTVFGGLMGLAAAVSIAFDALLIGLGFILVNRLADGLDGAVARASSASDFGGYLDIVFDFIFYSSIPFAFVLNDPANGLAACFLIFSFIGTATSFLGFAIIAAKRGISTDARGKKQFYHLGGLTEGAETIMLLCLMTLMPSYFTMLALGFGVLCWITTAMRIGDAFRMLSSD
ncbi:CDP-alcohol phosphatidyltransferase family protein [Candidatus Puniceispirillum sp.]|uniref:CDP-alcohol phosphatidyltransferase family protein n=1 Tax=Candidatus Puniceispirillum sp. TaxID=2026719 RepID=UPI003F69D552